MNRSIRHVLALVSATAIGAGLAAPAAAASVEGPKVTWNISMFGPKRGLTYGVEELARVVAEATGGSFAMNVHYGETLGPAKEMLDGLNIGAFDLAMVASGFTPGKLPVIEGSALPFLPTPTIYHAVAMRDGFYRHPAPNADVGRWGATLVMQGPFSSFEFVGRGAPPLALADWKGKRVRATGGDARAMQLLGAAPTSLASTEYYAGLERGILDAVSSLPYAHIVYRLHEISTWYTTNLALSTAASPVLASTRSINALPPQYRKLIADSAPGVVERWTKVLLEDDLKGIEQFKARGMRAITYAEPELARLRAAIRPIWDEWVADMNKRGNNGQELLDLMIESAGKARLPS